MTYSGVDLKALVGLIDDKHPRTFNVELATTAPGYLVRVIGADGFSHDFTSADVATENIVVANKVAAAGASSWPCLSAPPSTRPARTRPASRPPGR